MNIAICPGCGADVPANNTGCISCGYENPADGRILTLQDLLAGPSYPAPGALCLDAVCTAFLRRLAEEAVKEHQARSTPGVGNTQPGAIQWPAARRVARLGEMEASSIALCLEADGDVGLEIVNGTTAADFKRATIQFCAPGAGGGLSSRTRIAAIALMRAIELDNAESPSRAGPGSSVSR